jgi:hypothetical protein
VKKNIIVILISALLTATILIPCVNSINVQDKPINPTTSPNNFQVKCAWSGEGSNVNKWAKTPKIDLMDIHAPLMIISTQYEILHLGDEDYGYIKISNDSGASWSIAHQFQGYSPVWREEEISLKQWQDEEIIIGFHFSTKANSISDGWFIRNIIVRGIIEEVYNEDFSTYDLGDSWLDWTIIYQDALPNAPPVRPSILGPAGGSPNKEFEFTFAAYDYDENDVYYKVDWGDGEVTDWFGPFTSGHILVLNHTWTEKGTYTIKAKAKDINDEESKWAQFQIKIPRDKQYNHLLNFKLIERLLEHLISSFPIFGRLLSL